MKVLSEASGHLRRLGNLQYCLALGFVCLAVFWMVRPIEVARSNGSERFVNPKIERQLTLPNAAVGLAWSPDSSTLATGILGNTLITLWDVRTGVKLQELRRQLGSNIAGDTLSFTKNGKYLLTPLAVEDEETKSDALTLWEVKTGSIIRHIPAPPPSKGRTLASHVAISPSGDVAVAIVADKIVFYDIRDWTVAGVSDVGDDLPDALSFSPDGARLAVGTVGGNILLFDPLARTHVKTIEAFQYAPGFHMSVGALAFSSNSYSIAAGATLVGPNRPRQRPNGTYDKTASGPAPQPPADSIRIWDVTTGVRLRMFAGAPRPVYSLSWSSQKDEYLASASADHFTRFWNTTTSTAGPSSQIRMDDVPIALMFSPDGSLLAVSNGDHVSIFTLQTSD